MPILPPASRTACHLLLLHMSRARGQRRWCRQRRCPPCCAPAGGASTTACCAPAGASCGSRWRRQPPRSSGPRGCRSAGPSCCWRCGCRLLLSGRCLLLRCLPLHCHSCTARSCLCHVCHPPQRLTPTHRHHPFLPTVGALPARSAGAVLWGGAAAAGAHVAPRLGRLHPAAGSSLPPLEPQAPPHLPAGPRWGCAAAAALPAARDGRAGGRRGRGGWQRRRAAQPGTVFSANRRGLSRQDHF